MPPSEWRGKPCFPRRPPSACRAMHQPHLACRASESPSGCESEVHRTVRCRFPPLPLAGIGRMRGPMSLLASIPSPSSSTVEIGPLSIHFYGLTLLVAIAAAVGISGLRWTRRGGDWDLIFRVAAWGVALGIVGARLYHVVTSWDELPDAWWGPFAIWKGGLGVWGGIGLGVIVGAIVAKKAGVDVAVLADCAAPGLLVAQGIGRFGNWWNQELFGKPTSLPWGLES